MNNPFKREVHEPSDLEEAITELIAKLRDQDPDTDEYTKMAANLKTLMEARTLETECEKDNRPSADQVAAVIGNIVGIAMILGFEKSNVLTSKALNLVIKPRT